MNKYIKSAQLPGLTPPMGGGMPGQNPQQDLPASSDQAVERAVSSLVLALLKNKLPNAVPYVFGFHLMEYDDSTNKGLGFIILRLGEVIGYIPVVFDRGEVRGLDIMHIKEYNIYVPATDDWIKFFTATTNTLAGSPIDKSTPHAYPTPDITRAALPPSKQASFTFSPTYLAKLWADYKIYGNYYKNMEFGEKLLKTAKKSYSEIIRKLPTIKKALTKKASLGRLPPPISLSNAPPLIDVLYKHNEFAALDLANEIINNPVSQYYADNFYKNSRIWSKLKNLCKQARIQGSPEAIKLLANKPFAAQGPVKKKPKPQEQEKEEEEEEAEE